MSDTAPSDRETGVLQPGQVIRPVLGKEAPTMLALKLFGLTVEGESSNPHIKEPSPDGYVLKVTNSLDSKKSKIMAAQVEMMLFLHSRGFKVSKPEKNVHGSHLIYAKISGDEGIKRKRVYVFLCECVKSMN
ncbi:Hydroxylysine kinase [Portunus trituberculatus]|uniref:Hydroxylysine kinase n=1 Tax=Portunus trituberculatus TaxID=210409 RepID=A0A5B7K5M9_PORTR|nr:Hydroxylysine kinase [Portunus trituberculatus]